MSYAKEQLGLKRLLALVNFDNQRSIKLLDKLGFHYERNIQLSAQDEKEVRLFGTTI
jgi:RimJ/RimL family protein N-acetyltransferase